MGNLSKKQIKKLIDKECYFCGEDDYELLDAHRIVPGKDGGKYTEWNMVTACSLCHRKCHTGRIEIIGKHSCSSGKSVIIYIEDGEEKIK
jgi:hypothetical protein